GDESVGFVASRRGAVMTRQKSFKQRVRSRMDKTGESYTAARAHLIGTTDTSPEPAQVSTATPGSMRARVSDDKVRVATGHGYQAWFALLDAWAATTRTHTEIAAHRGADQVRRKAATGWSEGR